MVGNLDARNRRRGELVGQIRRSCLRKCHHEDSVRPRVTLANAARVAGPRCCSVSGCGPPFVLPSSLRLG
jgi:hypothetical protein